MIIQVKRAYETATNEDGFRVLVDRLWPRGLSKEKSRLDLWFKDVAPSSELRTWFGHDPAKFEEFEARYQTELDANGKAVGELLDQVKGHDKLTLIYAAHDEQHNHALVLKAYLESHQR